MINKILITFSPLKKGVKDVQSPSVSLITQPMTAFTESPMILSHSTSNRNPKPKLAYHEIQTVTPLPPHLPSLVDEPVIHAPPLPPPPPPPSASPARPVKSSKYYEPEEKYFSRHIKKPAYSKPLEGIKYLKKKFYPNHNNLNIPSTNYATHYDPISDYHHQVRPRHHQISSDSTEKQQNSILYDSNNYDKPAAIYLSKENDYKAPYEEDNRHYNPLPPPPLPLPPTKHEPPKYSPAYRENYDQHYADPLMIKPHFEPVRVKQGEPVMPLKRRPSAYPPRIRHQSKLASIPVPETIYSHTSSENDMKPKVYYERPDIYHSHHHHNHQHESLMKPPSESERYHLSNNGHNSNNENKETIYINKLSHNEQEYPNHYSHHQYHLGPNNYVKNEKQLIYPLADDITRRKSYQTINNFKSNLRNLFPYIDRNKQDPYGGGPLVDDASEKINSFLVEPANLQPSLITSTTTTTSSPPSSSSLSSSSFSTVVTANPKMSIEKYMKVHATSLAPLYRD